MATLTIKVYVYERTDYNGQECDSEISGATVTIYDTDGVTELSSGTTNSSGIYEDTITVSGTHCLVKAEKTGYTTRHIWAAVADGVDEYVTLELTQTNFSNAATIRARLRYYSDGNWLPAQNVEMRVTIPNTPAKATGADGLKYFITSNTISATSDENGVVSAVVPLADDEELRVFRVTIPSANIDRYVNIPPGTTEVDLGTINI